MIEHNTTVSDPKPRNFVPDHFNDLLAFDPATLAWADPLDPAAPRPPPRHSAGFASEAGRLYLFGGVDDASAQ